MNLLSSSQPLDSSPESFNDWGERVCHKFVLVLGEDGTKVASPEDFFDKPFGEMS